MDELRKIEPTELEAVFNLSTYAFNAARTEKRRERVKTLMSHSQSYGYFENGILASQVIATEFQVNFHGTVYDMVGIGYVASYPEYRGNGSISKIMSALLKEFAEKKVPLAYLAPFSYPFYRQYGFEQLFEQVHYTVAAAEWPSVRKQPGQLVRVSFAQAEKTIQTIYMNLSKNQRGGLIRETWWWSYAYGSDESNQFALYKNEWGEYTGYLIYQSTRDCFLIKDWGYSDQESFYALVGFIGSHRGSSLTFSLTTSFGGENLAYLMPVPSAEVALKPYMMGRIVNLEAFIQRYPFAKGATQEFELLVEDPYIASNQGKWVLQISAEGIGKISNYSTEVANQENKGKISGAIQQITQFLMGYQKPSDLYFFGKISGDIAAIEAIEQRLVKERPLLEDYF